MDWMKIGSALLLGMMVLLLARQLPAILKNTPDAEKGDWPAFILPIIAVAGFVALLMWLV